MTTDESTSIRSELFLALYEAVLEGLIEHECSVSMAADVLIRMEAAFRRIDGVEGEFPLAR